NPCTRIDIGVAERRAHEFLHEIGFLVRAARRSDAADRVAAVPGLDALEFRSGVIDGLFPAHLPPRIGNPRADHRLENTIRMRRVVERELSLSSHSARVLL